MLDDTNDWDDSDDSGAGDDSGDGGDEVTVESLQEQLKGNEEALAAKETELSKLREKDTNFSNYRKLKEKEKEKFKEEMSGKERMLMDEIDNLSTKIDQRDEATIGKFKTDKLKSLSGGDAELEKKIEAEIERLGPLPLTTEGVNEQYEEAMVLVNRKMSAVSPSNPLTTHHPTTGVSPWSSQKRTNNADTKDGKAFAKELGLQTEPRKDQ